MTKLVHTLDNDTDMLDEILEIGENNDISFKYINKMVKIPTKKFFGPKKKTELLMKDHASQHPSQHVYPHIRGNKRSFKICHHCERYGHIRPFCYRLYGYPQLYSQPRSNRRKGKKTQARKEWKSKETITYLIAHISL